MSGAQKRVYRLNAPFILALMVASLSKLKTGMMQQLNQEGMGRSYLPNKGFLCVSRWRRAGTTKTPSAPKPRGPGAGGGGTHTWSGP